MINQYTVIGQPIAHSLSPVVHNIFGDLTQRKINYTRTEGTPETFEEIVLALKSAGLKGCNVTAPFKEQAFAMCDRLHPHASRAGSVNTIHMQRDDTMVGHNTDGLGLVADLQVNHRRKIHSSRVLILGAGGAVRGVIAPILSCTPSSLHIANRTATKADTLASRFSDLGSITASGYEDLEKHKPYDIVINAMSPGPDGSMPVIPSIVIGPESLAYDMTYATLDTPFMQWAQQTGAQTSNGLGMLVEQAAESFFIWEGVRPKTRLVFPRLREQLTT